MFKLTDEQLEKLGSWMLEQDKKVAEKQNRSEPYGGAIGGFYSYIFTPNSIGMTTVVKNNFTNEEINLTDYESW